MNGSARPVGALVALSVSTFAYVTTETLPIGLLMLMSKDLRTSPSAVGLLVTCYGLVVVVASIPLTQLTRRIPRRYLLSGLLAGFVVATWLSAAAPNYRVLLVARVGTALTQALFWSVVVPTTAGLFSARVRGRAVAIVLAGSSLAAVLGVPAGTWIGQQAGWRMAFLALSGLGLLAMVTIAIVLPTTAPGDSPTARGTAPDARRYWVLTVLTMVTVTGTFVSFTYVTPFLAEVSRFPSEAVFPVLLIRGVAGVIGVLIGGALVDRDPWRAMIVPAALQAAALLMLYALGSVQVVAVVLIALSGLAFGALMAVLGNRVLQIAPGSADLASAGLSTAVNVGITAGAFIGGVLLPAFGVRSTVLIAGLLSLAGLAVGLGEPLVASTRVAGRRRSSTFMLAHESITARASR